MTAPAPVGDENVVPGHDVPPPPFEKVPDEPPGFQGLRGMDPLYPLGEQLRLPPAYTVSNDVLMTFLAAQSQFIRAQAYFLEEGRHARDDTVYIQHLTAFGQAQSAFIRAQQDFLARLGIV